MIRRLLVICAVLLALPASAQANWKIDRAQAIAEHVWNYDYGCNDGVSITLSDPARAFTRETTAAQLSHGRFVLAWTNPAAPQPDRCVIYLNGPWFARWGMGWSEVCSAMIHEYGHLAGREHSTDPRSIMYPDYQPDRRCRKRGKPYLDRYRLDF